MISRASPSAGPDCDVTCDVTSVSTNVAVRLHHRWGDVAELRLDYPIGLTGLGESCHGRVTPS